MNSPPSPGRAAILLLAGLLLCAGDARAEDTATSEAIVYREDVVYGRVHGAGLLADIAYPKAKSDKPLPAIVSVHGGRWRGGHKKDGSTIKVKQWAGFGFFAMSIDYRLVGASPAPACYQDFQCAIRYVHAHADQYKIDKRRIFVIGQSAGGHLVSLAATIGDGPWKRTGGWEEADNEIAAAISVAACYELPTLSWGNIWTPAGRGLNLDQARKQASPVYHVKKDMVPLMIMHSDNDRSVPIDNALLMVEALKKADARRKFHRYPKLGHMGIIKEVIDRSLEFIEKISAE
jgi:acetyl esterase